MKERVVTGLGGKRRVSNGNINEGEKPTGTGTSDTKEDTSPTV